VLQHIKKILLIRATHLGDVVLTLPALKPLKEKFKQAEITFLTGTPSQKVLVNNPYIDKVFVYDPPWYFKKKPLAALQEYIKLIRRLRREKFEIVIDFRDDLMDIFFIAWMSGTPCRVATGIRGGNFLLTRVVPVKNQQHKIQTHMDLVSAVGASSEPGPMKFYFSEQEEKEKAFLLHQLGITKDAKIIGIHAGVGKPRFMKYWLSERFAKIADKLIETYGVTVVFTGSKEEIPLIKSIKNLMHHNVIIVAGKTDVRQLALLIREMSLLLTTDSAPMHIAAAVDTPVVALFGPSDPNEFGPKGNLVKIIDKNLFCRKTCDAQICNNPYYHQCMEQISWEEVFAEIKQFYESDISLRG
jgi:lipopolysaccharide heptosyltransferase II